MMPWPEDDLWKIRKAVHPHISPFRDDGKTCGAPTWIWSVAVDGRKSSANFDQLEYARQAELVATGWTPREVFDRAGTDVRVARQHVVRPFTPTSLALSPGAD